MNDSNFARVRQRLADKRLYKLAEDIAERFHLTMPELLGPKRTRTISRARAHLFYALHKELGMSLHEVGDLLDCNHSSVLHGCRRVMAGLNTEVA